MDPFAPATPTHRLLERVVIHIKVGGVGRAGHLGHERGHAHANVVPVNAFKEGVRLEVLNALLAEAQLLTAQQAPDEVLGTLRNVGDVWRELQVVLRKGRDSLKERVHGEAVGLLLVSQDKPFAPSTCNGSLAQSTSC